MNKITILKHNLVEVCVYVCVCVGGGGGMPFVDNNDLVRTSISLHEKASSCVASTRVITYLV